MSWLCSIGGGMRRGWWKGGRSAVAVGGNFGVGRCGLTLRISNRPEIDVWNPRIALVLDRVLRGRVR